MFLCLIQVLVTTEIKIKIVKIYMTVQFIYCELAFRK